MQEQKANTLEEKNSCLAIARQTQSLAKTSNLVFRDDVSKNEQGFQDVRPLFRRMDYFASWDARKFD